MLKKRKQDCTPDEWQLVTEQRRAYEREYRKRADRKAYTKTYLAEYVKTDEYRGYDKLRYGEKRREAALKNMRQREYGASPELVTYLMHRQDFKCAVCHRPFENRPEKKHVAHCLDHDHDSGHIRGLLCRMCNTFEGFLRQREMTPEQYASRLAAYLENTIAEDILW